MSKVKDYAGTDPWDESHGDYFIPSNYDLNQHELSRRVVMLGGLVQSLLDYISKKEGVELEFRLTSQKGYKFEIYNSNKKSKKLKNL